MSSLVVTKENGQTLRYQDSYSLPKRDDTLTIPSRFSTLAVKPATKQEALYSKDRKKTAFLTGNTLCQFEVTPVGLCNDPASFGRLMELVSFLDDIIFKGKNFEELKRSLLQAQESPPATQSHGKYSFQKKTSWRCYNIGPEKKAV